MYCSWWYAESCKLAQLSDGTQNQGYGSKLSQVTDEGAQLSYMANFYNYTSSCDLYSCGSDVFPTGRDGSWCIPCLLAPAALPFPFASMQFSFFFCLLCPPAVPSLPAPISIDAVSAAGVVVSEIATAGLDQILGAAVQNNGGVAYIVDPVGNLVRKSTSHCTVRIFTANAHYPLP